MVSTGTRFAGADSGGIGELCAVTASAVPQRRFNSRQCGALQRGHWAGRVVRFAGGPRQLNFSRWKGEPTKVTLERDGSRLVGKASFQGRPLPAFSPTPEGKRVRTFVFLDCFACPASPKAWGRLTGVAPKPDGSFRVLLRPDWTGKRYRATVAGPNIGATLAPDARALL